MASPGTLQAAGESTISIARRRTQNASASWRTAAGMSPLRSNGGRQRRLKRSARSRANRPVLLVAAPVPLSWAAVITPPSPPLAAETGTGGGPTGVADGRAFGTIQTPLALRRTRTRLELLSSTRGTKRG